MTKSSYTSSSLQTARACLRRYELQYLKRLQPFGDPAIPLVVGTAWHKAHEARAKGLDPYAAIRAFSPSTLWATKLAALLAGHDWRWRDDAFEVEKAELTFAVKLNIGGEVVNMEGQIDAILRDESGRRGILDYKTTSEALDGRYFERLRMEPQVGGIYATAFEKLYGEPPAFVLYDVVRKPTINPKKVSKGEIERMRHDPKTHGTYYGKALREEEIVNAATEGESEGMYGARLLADIGDRPDYYFARRPIYRSRSEMEALLLDIKGQVRVVEDAIDAAMPMPRNADTCTAKGICPFIGLCERGEYPGDMIPEGFQRRAALHPELVPVDQVDLTPAKGNVSS